MPPPWGENSFWGPQAEPLAPTWQVCYAYAMHAATFTHAGLGLQAEPLTDGTGPLRLVWLHGWRADRESLRPLAHSLLPAGESWLIDLPGHGSLPAPTAAAGPADLAALVGAWLATLPPCPTVVLGHSMGFRVALHLAAQRTPHLKALVGLAAAGIPRQKTFYERCRHQRARFLLQLAERLPPRWRETLQTTLRQRYGSRDYLSCPPDLRPMFKAVVGDDASALLGEIELPVLLLYGDADTDTPPEMGQRMAAALPQGACVVLPGFHHFSLLGQGRHVVAARLGAWLKGL